MRILAVITTATLAVSAYAGSHNLVTADVNDPVTLRINIMQNVGAATGLASGMMKGNIPFDPIAAQAALVTINTAALGLSGLFPAGMEENLRSTAGPAIWTDAAGFKAAIAKFIADSDDAKSFPPATVEELQVAFAVVGANCKACHKTYRIKR
jgi:cytochrome c556